MKLYYSPGACSLSPHIALHEAGLAFEAIPAPTKTHQLPDGTDYYTINPLGYVPLLALDMYEHAYHMDFGAKAAAYVDAYMGALDWANADKEFARAGAS